MPAPKPSAAGTGEAFTIEHVSVTGGTVVFSNLRDRVESRIETINADVTIDGDRKIRATGNARTGEHSLKFDIKAAPPAPPIERQNIPTEFKIDAPGFLQAQLSGKAEVRLNGSVVMINGLTGALGDGAFNGWASVDLASKPLVKLDLDFQRLDVAMARRARPVRAAQPWSNATIDLNGLNYVDAQARISAAALNIGEAHFAPAAIEATLASGVLKTQFSNLGAYDGNANGDLTIDASTADPAFALRADLTGVRALPLLQEPCRFRQARRQDADQDQRALHRQQPARDHGKPAGHRVRGVPGRRHQGPQRRPDDPLADLEHACRAGRRARSRRPTSRNFRRRSRSTRARR